MGYDRIEIMVFDGTVELAHRPFFELRSRSFITNAEDVKIIHRDPDAIGVLTHESLDVSQLTHDIMENAATMDKKFKDVHTFRIWSLLEKRPLPMTSQSVLADHALRVKGKCYPCWPFMITAADTRISGEQHSPEGCSGETSNENV